MGLLGCIAQGCSLAADLEPLQAGDSALGCSEDEKVCEYPDGRGFCVSLEVAELGCDDPSCRPCTLVGADARCDLNNKCVVNDCKNGWADCDEDGLDCEVYTQDEIENCGACGTKCEWEHSINDCVNGVCVLSGCSPGWANCDDDQVNGCEVMTGETNECP